MEEEFCLVLVEAVGGQRRSRPGALKGRELEFVARWTGRAALREGREGREGDEEGRWKLPR